MKKNPRRERPAHSTELPEEASVPKLGLEVDIYQLVDDALLKANRSDGTGWDWCWAELSRDWMDATPSRHAYRCLPLSIANQTGWWIKNPVGFTATWRGRPDPGAMCFEFDTAEDVWKNLVNNQFGEGIITWNTPFLFRTRPQGSRLLICGPANYFLRNAHPLTAIIESDWMNASFTMNWKVMQPDEPVRFDEGIPLFQAIPLLGNVCSDLEKAAVTYRKLADDPEMANAYNEWSLSRSRFHEQKANGEVKADGWQKDYFQGRDATGRKIAPAHFTKVRTPAVHFLGSAKDSRKGDGMDSKSRRPDGPEPLSAPTLRLADSSGANGTATLEPGRVQTPEAPSAPARLVNDEWRRWIAENLLLNQPKESLVEAMTASGISPEEASDEIDLALQSPYVRGADRLRERLKKRDWLLTTYRKLNRLHPKSAEVERRARLSRDEFLQDYYSTNRPVIITGMMDDWPATRKWDLDYFTQRCGDREVEVQYGRKSDDGYLYEAQRDRYVRRLKFSEYVEMVRSSGVTNGFYVTANNNSYNKQALSELWEDIVQVPEYLDGQDPLSGFFWFGPAGTITPFHHDLTNNFMAQVLGRKRVKIVPSWDMPHMANEFHVYSRLDGRVLPASPRPGLESPQVLECLLNPGEILFLPIGCMHYVEGVDISVTISFTNFLFDNDFSTFYNTYHDL